MPTSPRQNAKAITVINLKGGVGKTHTTWLLASVCQERGEPSLIVDTDTQANLTRSLLSEDDGRPRIESLFDPAAEPDAKAVIRHTPFSQIDLIPASPRLASFDVSHRTHWEKSDLHLSLVDSVEQLRPEYRYIVFDCPPRLSVVSFAALCASDYVIIPLEAADWGAQGIVQVAAAIQEVQQRYNPRLRLLGYLVSRFKRARSYQQSYLQQLREHFGPLAFDTVIPDLAQFEKSVTDAIPITLHSRSSRAAQIARTFFEEVQERIERFDRGGRQRGQTNVCRDTALTL